MPRGARNRSTEPAAKGDTRDRILDAAERCIIRHGVRKTTMEDIASEVGMSRPGVYRYFSDRDDLLIELVTRHAATLRERAHKLMSRQDGLQDQIVEGLVFTVKEARLDPVMRYLVDPEGSGLGRRIIDSRLGQMMAAEFFDPFLDVAYVNNELPRDLPRTDVYLWLSNLVWMLLRGLEGGEIDVARYRSILRRFVAPAFAPAGS
ncbi:TetR/AcrR family transcriptional regulator [Mycobacterium sp. DBP42]|uniref:TetR/AcrR family transcriptional regulator n=1 Tax=Mycobacterium sp. DBP42 TaxID=2545267 RepID=UPI00110CD858|nr:TetR/AcrR family transcriptional regulator [Mycobacterium sp. DBP42]TMS53372.1 TetR/AcrR family transcriptional regulator [Mycobacterium sp. DBP42]